MTKDPKQLFKEQRRRANERGIKFELSFEEWLGWWETNLGSNWITLRGRLGHNYVMGRKRDRGNYVLGNIICITVKQNVHDGQRRTPKRQPKPAYARLNGATARLIYDETGTQRAIAVKYDVSERLVRLIKNKEVWRTYLPK